MPKSLAIFNAISLTPRLAKLIPPLATINFLALNLPLFVSITNLSISFVTLKTLVFK